MWLDKYLKKPGFKTPFDSEDAKESQTLLKSAQEPFSPVSYDPERNGVGKCLS